MLKTTLCFVQQLSDFGFTDRLMNPLKVSDEASVIAFDGAGKDLAGAPTNKAAKLPQNYAVPAAAAVCSCRRKKTPELERSSLCLCQVFRHSPNFARGSYTAPLILYTGQVALHLAHCSRGCCPCLGKLRPSRNETMN